MAHNFKLTGNYYISKAGNDSNTGTSKDEPWKTGKNGSGVSSVILGAGDYTFNYQPNFGGFNAVTIYADGRVRISGATWGSISNQSNCIINGVFFENCTITGGNNSKCEVQNSLLLNSTIVAQSTSSAFGFRILESILINVTQSLNGVFILRGSIVKNCDLGFLGIDTNFRFYNTYIDVVSNITLSNSINPLYFRNNNINGTLTLNGNKYAIQDQLTGTPQDNGYDVGVKWLTEANLSADSYPGTISGWNTAVATCINRDPKFNNPTKLDYSLRADSPHIRAAEGGVNNIGPTSYARSYYIEDYGIDANIISVIADSNIDTSNPADFPLISNPVDSQGIVTLVYKIGDQPELIGKIDYIGRLAYNTDTTGNTSTNENVPDSHPDTADMPVRKTTTSNAGSNTTIECTAHGATVGQYVRYKGKALEISSVTTNQITVTGGTFIENPLSGQQIVYGTFETMKGLNPNRLNYQARFSTKTDGVPTLDAHWDNNTLALAGEFLTMEWFTQPEIRVGLGNGDPFFDPLAAGGTVQATYMEVKVWMRDNYQS